MFKTKASLEKSALEAAIDAVLEEMKSYSSDSDEYAKMVVQLDRLYKLKAIDKPERVSLDTLATISANLMGIVLIVGFERANTVTSKALNLLMKPR